MRVPLLPKAIILTICPIGLRQYNGQGVYCGLSTACNSSTIENDPQLLPAQLQNLPAQYQEITV